MCQNERINSGFKMTNRCEEGNRLYQIVLEARQAYTNYQGRDETEAQELYNRYDKATEPHEHMMPIYRHENGHTTLRYHATVRGINRADETGYAMVATELSQAFIPVFWGNVRDTFAWIEQADNTPLTPEQFQALYRNEEATA